MLSLLAPAAPPAGKCFSRSLKERYIGLPLPGVPLMHDRSVRDVLNLYNPVAPLERAFTIPAPWYFDPRIAQLERSSVFASNCEVSGRLANFRKRSAFCASAQR